MHEALYCSCGALVRQCRCPGFGATKTVTTRDAVCSSCKARAHIALQALMRQNPRRDPARGRRVTHEVLPGLFVGNREDAQTFEGHVLCVLEWVDRHVRPDARVVPVLERAGRTLRATVRTLDAVAEVITELLGTGRPLLVHCRAGRERSPLAIVWWLHAHRGLPLVEAQALVERAHPQTLNRLGWIHRA